MPVDDHSPNFAYSLVATAPSPATTGTSLVVTAAQGSRFPTPPFNATIWPASTQPLTTNAEIVRVMAIATDTLTITRAQESSTARTVIIGDQIAATVTAKTFTDIEAGFSPDLALSSRAPALAQTIPAATSAYVVSDYEIAVALEQNISAANDNTALDSATVRDAQSISVSSDRLLTAIELHLIKTGSPAGSVLVEIRADSASAPASTTLASATISGSAVGISPGDFYRAEMSWWLVAGRTYWIVASATGAVDASNFWNWRGCNTDVYASGNYSRSTDSGSSWFPQATVDRRFRALAEANLELAADGLLEIG